jgi:N-acetyl-anhydromuramyl-L-alanine amidase AmpD
MIFSPNPYPFASAKYQSSREGVEIDTIVLHYTAGHGDERALAKAWKTPPLRNGKRVRSSAHFVVGRTGGTIQCVDTDRTANHAGGGSFLGDGSPWAMNWRSIGIEISNRGYAKVKWGTPTFEGRHRNPRSRKTVWEAYPDEQIEAVAARLALLVIEHPEIKYVTGHEDVVNHAVGKNGRGAKMDPGPAFPWGAFDWTTLEVLPMCCDFTRGEHRPRTWQELEHGKTEEQKTMDQRRRVDASCVGGRDWP